MCDKNNILADDVTLYIKDDLKGETLTSLSLSLSEIPQKLEWIEFDVSDIDVIPGQIYYIVLKSNSKSNKEYLYT